MATIEMTAGDINGANIEIINMMIQNFAAEEAAIESSDIEPVEIDASEIESIEIAESDITDAAGCFGLGLKYSAGAGVPVDLVQAHKWFNIAASRGHSDAAQLRREIAEQMSDSDIGSAQRAARDWLKAHPIAPVEPARIAA
jgi:TPR repeat protein